MGVPEKTLLKDCIRFPEVLSEAARRLEPQVLTHYLEELTTRFQKYYSSGNRIITENKDETLQKCILCLVVQQVIKNGLNLLGIESPERM